MRPERPARSTATQDRASKPAETVGLTPRTLLILVLGFSAGLLGNALIGGLSGGPEESATVVAQGESTSPQAEQSAVASPANGDEQAANRGAPAVTPTDSDVGRSNPTQPGAAPLVANAAVDGRTNRSDARSAPRTRRKPAIDPELLRELSEDNESDVAAPTESSEENAGLPEFFEDASEGATPPKASPSESAAPSAPETSTPRAPTAKLTLGHWNRLNEIIDQEAAMRGAPSGGVTASNAGDFLERRIEAGRFAAGAVRDLPQAGVDPQLLAFSERLAAWYEKGAGICEKGKWLLEKASDAARKGPEGKAWQKNDKEHQASVNGLNTDGETLRRKLAAKYGVAFPKLK